MDIKPPTFDIKDGACKWKKFLQCYNIYVAALGIEEEEKKKCNLLLHCMGTEGIDLYNTLDIKSNEVNNYNVLVDKLNDYFIPKINVTYERHKFFSRNQKTGETIDNYATDLKALAFTCEFGKLKDSLIKDRIVCGIENNKVRERLLAETSLSLAKCIDICRSAESTNKQLLEITNQESISASVSKVSAKKRFEKSFSKKGKQKQPQIINGCTRCGKSHKVNECPAFGAECYKCGKKNHFGKKCRNKSIKHITHKEENNIKSSSSSEELFIGVVSQKSENEDWEETLEIESSPKVFIQFKLDTGAQANLIPYKLFEKISNVKIEKSNTKLISYSGENITCVGKCFLNCKVMNKNEIHRLDFQIVKCDTNAPAILGLKACNKLRLIQRLNKINLGHNLLEEFKDVFEGIGCIKVKPHKIIINENANPKVYNARKVPYAINDDLKNELDKLENLGIIQKINEPTEWVNPMVIVKKPNNKLRICLDPRELNKEIKREFFQIPTIEDILSKLNGAKVFSVLDANMGFYQIPLDRDSSKLCCFATPFGRYVFKRLPFGISSAPEIFYKNFRMIFDGITGIESYIDDILVYGRDLKEHNENLRKLLERAREYNVKFNKGKCKFNLSEIKFLGHIVTSQGVKVDNEKVESIMKLPSPKSRKDVEKFLGLITYVSKFIPGLSEKTSEIRKLLNKKSCFIWNEIHEQSFISLKQILTNTPVLRYFDTQKPVTVSVDASMDGLGAVLLQDGLPVIYSSRALTETEKGYAQIEKEMLAVVFGCTRFHQYIFNKKVTVESDHKPLMSIYKKPLINAPLRLQRMLIKLQNYDIDIVYKKGTELVIADYLSRNYLPVTQNEITKDIEAHVGLVKQTLPLIEDKFKSFQTETKNDKVLQELLKYVKYGWPNEKNKLNKDLQEYWNYRDELISINDVIFKGQKAIVPLSLREEMLMLLHYNHLGVTKCQLRARECLFWPKINVDIEKFISNCDTCLNFRNSNTKEPLIMTEIPANPWQTVGADVFQFNGKQFILIIDYFSKFIETSPLFKLDSAHTITALKSVFARHGIPKIIRTDNGTNFSSEEFKKFTVDWNIKHITSSPTHAMSNGMVERAIQTFKNLMKKAEHDKKDPYLCILEYRTTPIDKDIPSPSKLLFNREVNGLLPKFFDNKGEDNKSNYKQYLYKRQKEQKKYSDRNSKDLKEFKEKDKVRVQNANKIWQPGYVVKKLIKPRTYKVRLDNGSVIERNRKYLIKDTVNKKITPMKDVILGKIPMRPKRNVNRPKLNEYCCNL